MAKIEKTLYPKYNLTVLTIHGEPSINDLLQLGCNFNTDNPTLNLILDFSKAKIPAMPFEQIELMAQHNLANSRNREGGKTAIIDSTDFGFGMARIYRSVSSIKEYPVEVYPFRSIKKAYSWLNISEEDM